MDAFPIDWLGRSGPCSLVVDLTPDEVRERLAQSLTSDSHWGGLVGSDTGFTGKIEGNSFSLRASWRDRSVHPTLHGEVEKTGTGSRIQFHIEFDPASLINVIIFACAGAVSALLLVLGADILLPLLFVLAWFLIFGLHSRNRSKVLLQFFLGLFEDSRMEKAVPPA
jgi:hypothetical protein